MGNMPYGGATTTDLHDNNFKMIKANARGEDSGFNLFGFIPIVSPSYADAMRDLHTEVNMEGRSTALANVAQDRSTMYFILFSL